MNRKIVSTAAIAIAAFAGAAHAESPIGQSAPFNSVRTRAEVLADLQQNNKAGFGNASTSYGALPAFRSARTRDAVTAEYIAARHEVAARNAEGASGAPVPAQRSVRDTLAGQPVNAQ